MPEKYVFPILMLVIWPVHFFYVRSAIFSILRAAMSKTMIRKQRKVAPQILELADLPWRRIGNSLPIRIWYYCELLKYPLAALTFYVLMWLLGVPLDPLRKWPAIVVISSELPLAIYFFFFTVPEAGTGDRLPAWTVKHFSPDRSDDRKPW